MKQTAKKTEQNKRALPGHQAYQAILKRASQNKEKDPSFVERLSQVVQDDLKTLSEYGQAFNELTQDEFAMFKAYVKRDVHEAAQYMQRSGKSLKDWFGFDVTLIESRLLHSFLQAADDTKLTHMQLEAQAATYLTGEHAGPGTFRCDQCGALLHFHAPARIPPCATCHHTRFHRYVEAPH